MKKIIAPSIITLFLFFSCTQEKEFHLDSLKNSSLITFESNNLYPEGIAYHKKSKSIFLSSYTKGSIYSLDAKNNLSVLFQSEKLISPAAIAIDQEKNYLYVANGDAGVSDKSYEQTTKKISGVLIYDLTIGQEVKYVDFTKLNIEAKCYANGLTLDKKGNIYITDSHRPMIYKIDKDTHQASIFIEDSIFDEAEWNLNGIAYHCKGYLIVAHMSKGLLFKIDIEEKNIREIQLNEKITGVDGVLILNRNQMLINQAFEIQEKGMTTGALKLINTDDNWETGVIIDKETKISHNPTNSIVVDNRIYALNSFIGSHLFAGKNRDKFSIIEIK